MVKNTFVLMTITCPIVLAITQKTKQNIQTMFILVLILKKILVWKALYNRAMPKSYFRLYKLVAVNKDIYINECLQSKLLPFIHKHHGDFNYLFQIQPEYIILMRSWHRWRKMYTEKASTPQNAPQARPNENFCTKIL